MQHWWLADSACTLRHAAAFSDSIAHPPCTVFLCGALGAGKTTWVRGLLAALGYRGLVRSPTYTLAECYPLAERCVVHLDLYRLQEQEELELIGVREYFTADSICLVEWPERFAPLLPAPDWTLHLACLGTGRVLGLRARAEDESLSLPPLAGVSAGSAE